MSQNESGSWRRGIVKAVDGKKARVRVQLPDEDGILTDWLPVVQAMTLGARSYRLPREETQVVVLMDEHGEDGVVLGAIYSTADLPPVTDPGVVHLELEDGTTIHVDEGRVNVSTPGRVTVNGQSVTVKAILVTVDGALKITGNCSVGSGVTSSFTTASGKIVSVQNGIITNVS